MRNVKNVAGRYPGDHGIIGNIFYDSQIQRPNNQRVFFNHNDSRLTKNVKWWNKREPIWATATMQGLKFANILFSRYIFCLLGKSQPLRNWIIYRCDMKWNDIKTYQPFSCENVFHKDSSRILSHNLEVALIQFQTNNVNAAIVSKLNVQKKLVQNQE